MEYHSKESSFHKSNDNQLNATAKCVEWLQKSTLSDDNESIYTETSESSNLSYLSNETDLSSGALQVYTGNKGIVLNKEVSHEELESIITQTQNIYTNVQIKKSKNVHLGNVTYINGPVYVNQNSTVINHQTTINQYIKADKDDGARPPLIVTRTYWLAQPPINPYKYLKSPAKFVVITHSASEEGITQPENILLVRLIQQFHIESRHFDDIAYNFLIGADGSIYEGRGWNVEGAFAYAYNKVAVGICFIGCFTTKLPSALAMEKAKQLIAYGVNMGVVDQEYSLIGHCQCTPNESPGRMLFEEMKSWDRFDESISVEQPSHLIN